MIDSEAIQRIQDTAVRADKPQIVKDLADRGQLLVSISGDRKCEVIDIDPPPRSHQCHSLGSLIGFAINVVDEKHGDGVKPVVWVGDDSVQVVVDDGTRRDVATLNLVTTPQLAALANLAPIERTQKEFYKLLRIELFDILPGDTTLLSKVKSVKWKDVSDTGSDVGHGSESIDRNVRQAIQGTDTIPETVDTFVRIFQAPDLKQKVNVKCAIDIDPDAKTFRMIPLPMQIEDAVDSVIVEVFKAINDAVKSRDIQVYRGTAN